MRNLLFILIFFAGILVAGADLTVLAVSDTHAGCWRWKNIADVILKYRRMAGTENVLLLDAGDSLQGSWEGSFSNGALPLAIMNELQVDAWVPGNHDFEGSSERFLQFRGALLGGDWQTARVKPRAWAMFERAGHKIAVIGLGEWGMRNRALPDAGLMFADPEAVLAKAVREAQDAGADLLILVQHDGIYGSYGTLYRRLKKFPEIHLVIGAHNHQEVPGKKIGGAWYVQPGSHGSALGVIRVQFRSKGEIPVLTSTLEKLPVRAEYRFPQEIYADLAAATRAGKKVFGHIPGGLAQPADRDMKGPFGDLVEKTLREETGAAAVLFCMYQGDGRSSETVTAASLYRVYPYESRIYSVALFPQELQVLIREMVSFQRRKKGLAIRFGGVKVYRDKRGFLQKAVLPPPGADGRILIAVTDYELTGCAGGIPFLPGLLRKGLEYRNTNILLRDAMSRRLSP